MRQAMKNLKAKNRAGNKSRSQERGRLSNEEIKAFKSMSKAFLDIAMRCGNPNNINSKQYLYTKAVLFNAGVSLELCLKYVLYKHTNKQHRLTHSLSDLFNLLPAEIKNEIQTHYSSSQAPFHLLAYCLVPKGATPPDKPDTKMESSGGLAQLLEFFDKYLKLYTMRYYEPKVYKWDYHLDYGGFTCVVNLISFMIGKY